jgi:hypothetical protein
MNENYEYEVTIVIKSSMQVGRDEKQPNNQEAVADLMTHLFGEMAPDIYKDYVDSYKVEKTYVGDTGKTCACCDKRYDIRDMMHYNGTVWHCKKCQLEIDRIA